MGSSRRWLVGSRFGVDVTVDYEPGANADEVAEHRPESRQQSLQTTTTRSSSVASHKPDLCQTDHSPAAGLPED